MDQMARSKVDLRFLCFLLLSFMALGSLANDGVNDTAMDDGTTTPATHEGRNNGEDSFRDRDLQKDLEVAKPVSLLSDSNPPNEKLDGIFDISPDGNSTDLPSIDCKIIPVDV